jgi:RHS repeat-associated protein
MIWACDDPEFDGDVADCRVYNRALAAAEVAAIYATPPGTVELTEIRDHNGLNQITRIKEGADEDRAFVRPQRQPLDDGTRIYKWDVFNRLVEVKRASDSAVIGTYTYDALGRRIRKVISNGGISGNITNGTTDFLYTGWQCVEERDLSNDPQKQYIWGTYIDELIQQKIDISGTPADQYPLQDLLYRTIALTNSSGSIIEAYDYDAYGNTLIFTAPGAASNWWADDATQGDEPTCSFLFTGRRLDAESEIYQCRLRYYDPVVATFNGRDPLLYASGDVNVFRYVYSQPSRFVDPLGLGAYEECLELVNKYINREKKRIDDIYEKEKEKHRLSFYETWSRYDLLGGAPALTGGSMATIGWWPKPYPRKGVGGKASSGGTSYLSEWLSKKLPKKLNRNIWAPTPKIPLAKSKTVGRIVGRWIPWVGTGLLIYDGITAVIAATVPHYDQEQLAWLNYYRDQALSKLPNPGKVCECLKGVPTLDAGTVKWNPDRGKKHPDWEQWPDWVRRDYLGFGMDAILTWGEASADMKRIQEKYGLTE